MKSALPAIALLTCCMLQGCDRRQSDGHSSTPPTAGAASTEPEPSTDATQGEVSAAPPPDAVQPDLPPLKQQVPAEPQPAEPQPGQPQDPEVVDR